MFGFDVGGFVLGTLIISLVVPLVITAVVIIVIVWAIRRAAPSGDDVAVQQLRDRFARGEIDQSEFMVRMDALKRET